MPDDLGLTTMAPRRSGNFEARELGIEGLLLIEARRFGDTRGVFAETYNKRDFIALGIDEEFVQDNQSRSAAIGTVRGLHFQTAPHAQAKLVRVLNGSILDVAVDLRSGSATFGRHVVSRLCAENSCMLYVPTGFAHGFITLEPETEVAYKVTSYYAPDCDGGVAWDDPTLDIKWGIAPDSVTLSDKDRKLPRLAELPKIAF